MGKSKYRNCERRAADFSVVPLDGYPSLTEFINSDHDRTTLVFKRFDDLAIRNLLYLQSELAVLQKRQKEYDAEDRSLSATLEMKSCAMSWEKAQQLAGSGDEKQKLRVQLAQEIRVKIKEYREALVLESTFASIKPPPTRTFEAMRHAFFHKDDQGGEYPILTGSSNDLYDENKDLVLLKHPEHQDLLTTFMHNRMPILFASGKRNKDTIYVSESRIAVAVNIMSVAMAIILLLVAIICLHVVSSPVTKIVLIGVFLVLFAVTVGLFTKAKRSEVFGATAAYAAVLVVFVSGDLGSQRAASSLT